MGPPQATNFQFITSINTVARDDETRRKVRSHARRQKLSNDSGNPTQPRKSSTQKERTSKFRVKPSNPQEPSKARTGDDDNRDSNNDRNSHVKAKSAPSLLRLEAPPLSDVQKRDDNSNFTPTMVSKELALVVAKELPSFPMLRIETTPLTEPLLKYCFTVCLCPQEKMIEKWFNRNGAPTYMMTYYSGFLANAFAMNPEGNFFDALHVDTAITHAFMALVASMHNALARWDDTSTFDFHRLQAIKAINDRLNVEGKTPGIPISDGITMAVALLVNNEAFTGSIDAAAAHMSGLKRIIDLRGGILEAFKYNPIVQRALVWADFSYASVAGQPLMFPLVPGLTSSLGLHDHLQTRSAVANAESQCSKSLIVGNQEVVDNLELLSSITVCLNSFDYTNLAGMSTERVQLSNSIYLAEFRLFQLEDSYRLLLPKEGEPLSSILEDDVISNSRRPPPNDLSEILVWASHLYLHLALRGQPPSAPRHRALTESLMSSLCDTLSTLNLLVSPEPYGSPQSHYSINSINSIGNSSVDSWSTNTTNTSIHSPLERKPTNDIHKDMLLWALFIGSCVRLPVAPGAYQGILLGDHHEFFILALKNYCLTRFITDKFTLAAKLKAVVWLDSWMENQLDLIWAEVGDQLNS
ncbi:hypothetical protein GGR57DRAFT_223202 [Xylariaceae sp. FL1272]|nr:hypothetical protein GGR57DRAFT_223202 [Xylariaceae sp. FL1272]